MMIGAKSPNPSRNRRLCADGTDRGFYRLAKCNFARRLDPALVLYCTLVDLVYHTPSPPGQQASAPSLLPHFSALCGGGGEKRGLREGSAEQMEPGRVALSIKSSEGRTTCPSRKPFSSWRPAVHWPHAATPSESRPSAARLSVPVPQQSPVAASRRVPRSVRPVTWPTASSTRAGVTNTFSQAQALRLPFQTTVTPAQNLLSRGFSVAQMTKKDLPCSRKS